MSSSSYGGSPADGGTSSSSGISDSAGQSPETPAKLDKVGGRGGTGSRGRSLPARTANPAAEQRTAHVPDAPEIAFATDPQIEAANSAGQGTRSDHAAGQNDGGSYDRQEAIQEELHELQSAIRSARARISELTAELESPSLDDSGEDDARRSDQIEVAGEIRAGLDQVDTAAAHVVSRGRGQEPDDALAMLSKANSMEADARSERKRSRRDSQVGHLWGEIREALRKVSRRLWNLICKLLTVQQWSVTGGLSDPVLGLAGVSMTITFGKSG